MLGPRSQVPGPTRVTFVSQCPRFPLSPGSNIKNVPIGTVHCTSCDVIRAFKNSQELEPRSNMKTSFHRFSISWCMRSVQISRYISQNHITSGFAFVASVVCCGNESLTQQDIYFGKKKITSENISRNEKTQLSKYFAAI